MIKLLWLGLGGQEYHRHGPRQVFGPHRRLFSRLHWSYPSAPVSTIILSRWPSKSSVSAPIFFICKKDGSLWLCVWGLSDLTIKNQYLLPWIGALLSWLKCQFRQEVCFLGYVVSSYVVLTFQLLSTFHLRVQQDPLATHLDARDELINGLIN